MVYENSKQLEDLQSNKAIYVDLETTGVDVNEDRIVQIGIIYGTESLSMLINPERSIPEEVSRVHGITNEMVIDKLSFREIAETIYHEMNKAEIFIAYNAQFDFGFLQAELRRFGYTIFAKDFIFIDPMHIFKYQMPYTLSNAYKYYCGKELEGAHDALVDIQATKEVLMGQIAKDPLFFTENTCKDIQLKTIGDMSILGKWFDKKEDGTVIFKQGKNKGKSIDCDKSYLKWISNLDDITMDEKEFINSIL